MEGVVRWFERRGEIPLVPPLSLREYGSLTDDPDRFGGGYSTAGIRGVAFAIEYLESRGWTSIRTIRCLGIDTRHPASLTAYCHVRDQVCKFRIDRIISIMGLRSGRIVSSDEHVSLLAPYLPNDEREPYISAFVDFQNATRDGVFALLQLAMIDGRLSDESRDMVLDYLKAEADALAIQLPAFELIELWIDNLAPQRDAVVAAVTKLLGEKDKFARLLPWLLKVVRSQEAFPRPEESVRELIAAVRTHFRAAPRESKPIRVTR
jgi:hypothetical protein